MSGPAKASAWGILHISIQEKVPVATLREVVQRGWLPIESLSFPEPQNVNVGLQELARKSSWEKQEARVMAPGCFLRGQRPGRWRQREVWEENKKQPGGCPCFPGRTILFLGCSCWRGRFRYTLTVPSPHFTPKVRCDRSLGAGLHLSLLERGRDGVLFPAAHEEIGCCLPPLLLWGSGKSSGSHFFCP